MPVGIEIVTDRSAIPRVDINNLGVRLSKEFAVVIERLCLNDGEVVVFDSPSGSGKSTALGLIAGAIKATAYEEQRHVIAGQQITVDLPRSKFADPTKMGFVLQNNVLVPYLTLMENIDLPLSIAGNCPDCDWRAYLIGSLGLNGLEDRKSDQISVGQRQRAAIARAFIGKPRLLLLDEPVASLDPANADRVEAMILALASEAGASVVLASHQVERGAFREARRMMHRVEKLGEVTYSIFSEQKEVSV